MNFQFSTRSQVMVLAWVLRFENPRLSAKTLLAIVNAGKGGDPRRIRYLSTSVLLNSRERLKARAMAHSWKKRIWGVEGVGGGIRKFKEVLGSY